MLLPAQANAQLVGSRLLGGGHGEAVDVRALLVRRVGLVAHVADDARLQQALIAYQETAIQAAREVEDAIVALDGAIEQAGLSWFSADAAAHAAPPATAIRSSPADM